MAVDKQIIRETGTWTELSTIGGSNGLQTYMIGIATDHDGLAFRSDDGMHSCLDSTSLFTSGSVLFSTGDSRVNEDNTNFFWDDTNNRLGINDNTPSYSIDVTGDIRATTNIYQGEYRYHDGDGDTYDRFQTDQYNLNIGGVDFIEAVEDTSDYINFFSSNNRLYINDTDGEIGMGTASPSTPLHLLTTTNPQFRVAYDGSNYMELSNTGSYSLVDSAFNPLRLTTSCSGSDIILIPAASGDNVGINVTDPDTKLEVFHGGTQLKLSFDATDNCTFGVDTSGYLTITPSGDRVWLADNDLMTFGNTAASPDGQIYSDGTNLVIKQLTQDTDIVFNVNDGGVDTEIARFDGSTGNFGVGGLSNVSFKLMSSAEIAGIERSSDPSQPFDGEFVIWMSDGTGKGDQGDVLIASTTGITDTNYAVLFDHSAGSSW